MDRLNIPVLHISGQGIAESWEKSLIELYKKGVDIQTQYDNNGDRKSKDATMCIEIKRPLSEPMIHRDFPGGPRDLKGYVDEVVYGSKNHLVRDKNDPNDKRWQYTYNQRIVDYSVPGLVDSINQINEVVDKLKKCPYSRRAQIVTWKVWEDNEVDDPACLQSFIFRLIESKNGYTLNTNIRMRSNDAYKAAFMNIFAFVQLIENIKNVLQVELNKNIEVGRIFYQADSYHIYGKDLDGFEQRFLKSLDDRSFFDRTYDYEGFFKELMNEE